MVTVQSPTTALSKLQFVEPRQASSTAAVNVLPKSTPAEGSTEPSFQSKSTTSDSSAVVKQQQHEQKVAPSVAWTTDTARGGQILAVNVDIEHSAEGSTADMLLVDWQASFKSRSLEDILLESTTSPPRSLGHVTSRWTAGEEVCDEPRLTGGHASLAASHGSLNTGHASLHGSLELIQVS